MVPRRSVPPSLAAPVWFPEPAFEHATATNPTARIATSDRNDLIGPSSPRLLVEDAANDTPGDAALHRGFPRREERGQRVREVGQGQRLEPHLPGTGQRGQEDPVPTEQLVLDPRDRRDVEADGRFEHPDVSRVDPKHLAGLEVIQDDLSVQLDPRLSGARDLLEDEPLAAEHAGAQLLLERDGELDVLRPAQVPVVME